MPGSRHVLQEEMVGISRRLSDAVERLAFSRPVTHVYNPLHYARAPHESYLRRFARPSCRVLLVGMNPGPWGMMQTGVPFGEVSMVRDWMGIRGEVRHPRHEHPKRVVEGFACSRSEVSGRRLWGWAAGRFETPDHFFHDFFIWNHCPLGFLEETGRNRTPDKLPSAEREPLLELCDGALREVVSALSPEWAVGVGRFAQTRVTRALGGSGLRIGEILHPSPASPAANRGWAEQAEAQLRRLGIVAGP